MCEEFFGLFALTGTFGLSATLAKTIYPVIWAAFSNGSITVGRAIVLLSATGVGALVVVAIIGAGTLFISKKLKAGKTATLAW